MRQQLTQHSVGFSMPIAITSYNITFGNQLTQVKKTTKPKKPIKKAIEKPKKIEKTPSAIGATKVSKLPFDLNDKDITINKNTTLGDYFRHWVIVHKKNKTAKGTLRNYVNAGRWIYFLSKDVKVSDVSEFVLKNIISEYEKLHSTLMTDIFARMVQTIAVFLYDDKFTSTLIELTDGEVSTTRYVGVKKNINHQLKETGELVKSKTIRQKLVPPTILNTITRDTTFADFFEHWVALNRYGKASDSTSVKYLGSIRHLRDINSTIKVSEITRTSLQIIFDKYAQNHAKRTVSAFMFHLYGAVIDAYDMDLMDKLPTRKFTNRGTEGNRTKSQFLNLSELQKLIAEMNLNKTCNYDYLILFMAKTGARFAEALAVTKADFNERFLTINKTYNYKQINGNTELFAKTKTKNSVRDIVLDWHLTTQLQPLLEKLEDNDLLFGALINDKGRTDNCTFNRHLARLCKKAGVPVISSHGLRHTHASILFANGVSIGSVSKRLGHASIDITQRVYLHVTQELEDKDNGTMTKALSGIY